MSESEFLVHHTGPDDLYDCETWLEAVELANRLNAEYADWAEGWTAEHGAVRIMSWAIPYRSDIYEKEVSRD